ncbi:hypothetical protein [Pseudomonas oryzihabitans]|uniref:hypothetical protein n=1 Tax=Pseudomonas oryzihabitans TaxID=47885 RepID=UPI0028AF7EC7|nr:hypothetical protein [Pseudomonas oryzihabitans]
MPTLLVPQDVANEFDRYDLDVSNGLLYAMLNAAPHPIDLAPQIKHEVPDGYRLVRIDNRLEPLAHERFEVALLCDATQRVAYYNQVIVTGYQDINHRPATQVLVWRSTAFQHEAVLSQLARTVFFDYLLENYDVLVSDNQQTHEGQRFWLTQMSRALGLQLFVYHYHLLSTELVQLRQEADIQALRAVAWGGEQDHAHHLVIISKLELPAQLDVQAA